MTLAVNILLALASLVIGRRRLPDIATLRTGPVELDLPGILLFAATRTALLLFLMGLHPLLLASALLAGAGLTARELPVKEPFLDLRRLGGNLPLLATYTRTLLTMTVTYAFSSATRSGSRTPAG